MSSEERLDRIERQTEKNTEGIRDLIRLSGIFLDQQKQVTAQIEGLREVGREWYEEMRAIQQRDHDEWEAGMKRLADKHAETEQKLNILIDTVDRIIRSRDSGHQTEN
jgi:hypothetical protein